MLFCLQHFISKSFLLSLLLNCNTFITFRLYRQMVVAAQKHDLDCEQVGKLLLLLHVCWHLIVYIYYPHISF